MTALLEQPAAETDAPEYAAAEALARLAVGDPAAGRRPDRGLVSIDTGVPRIVEGR